MGALVYLCRDVLWERLIPRLIRRKLLTYHFVGCSENGAQADSDVAGNEIEHLRLRICTVRGPT